MFVFRSSTRFFSNTDVVVLCFFRLGSGMVMASLVIGKHADVVVDATTVSAVNGD
jgi:hypothetical protein